MYKNFVISLLLLLVATACDKVKDTPEPDVWTTFELRTVQVQVATNGSAVIDILSANPLPAEVTLRISQSPVHGSIRFHADNSLFIYEPEPGFAGLDSAFFEVCRNALCKEGRLLFEVNDTSTPCTPVAENFSLSIEAGYQFLPIDSVFDCEASLSGLLGVVPPFIQLESGRIKAAFPAETAGSFNFSYVVCSPAGRCDTANILLLVRPNCTALFQPRPDWVSMAPNFTARSIAYDSLLANDLSCPGDILPQSLQLLSQPGHGRAELREQTLNGRLFRFVRYFKDSTFRAGTDSVRYNVSTQSGATKISTLFFKIQ